MAPAGGTGLLQYNLYLDASLNLVWGDGSGGTAVAKGQSGPVPDTLLIHGHVYGGQNPVPGTYSDSVIVIMEW